jgi:hypothetical protein
MKYVPYGKYSDNSFLVRLKNTRNSLPGLTVEGTRSNPSICVTIGSTQPESTLFKNMILQSISSLKNITKLNKNQKHSANIDKMCRRSLQKEELLRELYSNKARQRGDLKGKYISHQSTYEKYNMLPHLNNKKIEEYKALAQIGTLSDYAKVM